MLLKVVVVELYGHEVDHFWCIRGFVAILLSRHYSTTKELIIEGWDHVSQEFINERVASMPQSFEDVI